ncbi:Conserved_hypothetical protein [Hexamita inflata]|uniref:Uncharacterized protein n=1 Tax=Hexamita inflata TaxID=28002 RepID=A0AA86TGJ4_9EUKA|nr:Conserved hypothetical protein [Hexamita inflata]
MQLVCKVMMTQSFKQCFSPASTIVGNRLTRTIVLNLQPNPLINFIPSDNMCQVLDKKLSSAFILLNSPSTGSIQLPPTGSGISFVYNFNKSISITYVFPDLPSYDATLDTTFGGYNLLLDNDIQVTGSVADVFHTRSNQTSCFSSVRFTYSLPDSWYSFEVQPVFCSVSSFSVFFEYQVNGIWRRIPVHSVDPANSFLTGGEYSTGNTQFLSIKRYLLDPTSSLERMKYSDSDRSEVKKMVDALMNDSTTKIRLSLDYLVQTVTASITAVALYTFSDNALKCHASMNGNTRATINENGLVYKTGFKQFMPCLEVPASDPRYSFAQSVKQNTASVRAKVLTINGSLVYQYKLSTDFIQFSQIPAVQFEVSAADTRTLIDSIDPVNLKIQLFVEFLDSNGARIFDFSTVPIDLVRTCATKRVLHIYDKKDTVVAWMKNDVVRCSSKGQKVNVTFNYTAVILENGNYKTNEWYVQYNLNNFSLPIIPISYDCSLTQLDKTICEKNRMNNIKPGVRENVRYYIETMFEFGELQFIVYEGNGRTWVFAIIVFGVIGLFTVVSVVALIFVQRSQ